MKTFREQLVQARAFDHKQNDAELLQQKWPGPKAGYACADYFTRGRIDQHAKDQRLFDLLIDVAVVAQIHVEIYREDQDLNNALSTLRAYVAKGGE